MLLTQSGGQECNRRENFKYMVYPLFFVHDFSQFILLLDLEIEGLIDAWGGGPLPNSLLYPKSQFVIVQSMTLHSL